ncbi:MAG TPA: cobalt-precorrin-6A reductase [Terriglobia bacterium]|nr:cobalt-precorrin-6A reductase [Terriglobia bacterium]
MTPKTLLILGGTTEGYKLAEAAVALPGLRVISSLAGRVGTPRLPAGEVRIGGYGGPAGLADYLHREKIDAVIDATHPFAARMGWNAAEACGKTGTALLRLERPAWQPVEGDRWTQVDSWPEASAALRDDDRMQPARRVFLALGRQELAHFTGLDEIWFLIRSVEAPDPSLHFAQSQLLLARGPFRYEDELALLKQHRIDTIICKNSGGEATDGKLTAARELGIRVVMLRRPRRPELPSAPDIPAAMQWLQEQGLQERPRPDKVPPSR